MRRDYSQCVEVFREMWLQKESSTLFISSKWLIESGAAPKLCWGGVFLMSLNDLMFRGSEINFFSQFYVFIKSTERVLWVNIKFRWKRSCLGVKVKNSWKCHDSLALVQFPVDCNRSLVHVGLKSSQRRKTFLCLLLTRSS